MVERRAGCGGQECQWKGRISSRVEKTPKAGGEDETCSKYYTVPMRREIETPRPLTPRFVGVKAELQKFHEMR